MCFKQAAPTWATLPPMHLQLPTVQEALCPAAQSVKRHCNATRRLCGDNAGREGSETFASTKQLLEPAQNKQGPTWAPRSCEWLCQTSIGVKLFLVMQ